MTLSPHMLTYPLSLYLILGAVFADLTSGSSSRLLTFTYEVSSGDATSRLDSWYSSNKLHTALVLGETGSILRLSTWSTTEADLSMSGRDGLNATSKIRVDGLVPSIGDAFIHSVTPSSASSIYKKDNVDTEILLQTGMLSNVTLGVASEVVVNISWSSAVTLVRGHHRLYLTLAGRTREAVYLSGNNTKQIQYMYTVALGDMFTRSTSTKCVKCYSGEGACRNPYACPWTLGLRYSPNAMHGDIRQLSSSPSLSVDKSFLALKHRDDRAGRTYGIPLYAVNDTSKLVLIDTSSRGSRETYLVDITTLKSDGVYGAGENIYLLVEFSDEVTIIDGANPPRIRLNLDNSDPYATYTSGSGGTKLKFLYRTKPGDNSSALDWTVSPMAAISNTSTYTSQSSVVYDESSFFLCNVTYNGSGSVESTKACGLVNNNGQAANVTLSASRFNTGLDFPSLTATALIEVSTMVPLITRVYSDKNDTSSELGYTVGEAINIMVEYDQPVALFSKPVLYVATRGVDSATPLTCVGYTPASDGYQQGDQDDDVEHSNARSSVTVKYGYSLLFEYIVQEGDYSLNLSLATSTAVRRVTRGAEDNALTLNYKQASIKRGSNFPVTDANLSVAHLFNQYG